MRRYTTLSGCLVAAAGSALAAFGNVSPVAFAGTLLAGLLATWFAAHWERRPPRALTVVTLAVSFTNWLVTLALFAAPSNVIPLVVALALLVSQQVAHRLRAAVVALLVPLVPLGVAALVAPHRNWTDHLLLGVVLSYGIWLVAALVNRYAWNLTVEIDAARRASADLAIAQERYRFAADLHDIQGHTLHVTQLKLRLAQRVLDTDAEGARTQLAEAQELIAETLANTRSLAFGHRTVSLASELSNAEALFSAAGIDCTVVGNRADGPSEELFGLVMREATTNILRHSQARSVTVALTPTRLAITNDGVTAAPGSLSGLARLADRFRATGGVLRTVAQDGTFLTEAEKP
jgi:two-component system sensor histidine kinase DesK